MKGTLVLNVVRGLLQRREAALERLPDKLHPYLNGPVLAHRWYPEEDYLALLRCLAEEFQVPGKDIWEYLGRKNAEIDLAGGTYEPMVVRGRPEAMLERLPRLWKLYRNSGRFVVDRGRRPARIELHDYAFLDDDLCRLLAGYMKEALRQAGAREVSAVVRCQGGVGRWELSWSEDAAGTGEAGEP